MCDNYPLLFPLNRVELHGAFGSADQYSWAYFQGWGNLLLIITYNKNHLNSTSIKINFTNWLSCYDVLALVLLLEEMVDNLLVIWVCYSVFIHLHSVQSTVWEDEFLTCAVDLVDVFWDLHSLDAFHKVKLPYSDLSRVITWKHKISTRNVTYTCNNWSVSFELLFEVDRISIILNLEDLKLIMITCSDNHLSGHVIDKRMAPWATKIILDDWLVVLVYDK